MNHFTRDEVAQHNNLYSLWITIDSKVYDLTDFADAHPGGATVLEQVAGTDATTEFFGLHRLEALLKYEKTLCVGTINGEEPQITIPKPGDLSLVPYAEPMWLTSQFKSPYFNESHRKLQRAMRIWVDSVLTPEAMEKEASGERVNDKVLDDMAYV
jgi:hypothetical protein